MRQRRVAQIFKYFLETKEEVVKSLNFFYGAKERVAQRPEIFFMEPRTGVRRFKYFL